MADERQELEELRRIDELERKAAGGVSTPKPVAEPKVDRTADIQKDVFKQAAKGSLSNLESVLRGSAAGVASIPGIPGSLSELGQKGVNLVAQKLGGEQVFDEKTSLPTAEGIFQKALKVMPRLSKKRPETAGMEELGSLYSPSLAPSAYLGGLKAIGKGIKGAEKGAEYIEKARGAAPAKATEALGEEVLGKVKPLVQEAETTEKALSKAQEELGKRGTVASARQAKREAEVETNLSKVSPNKGVLAEDVGGVIQNQGKENIEALEKTRKQEAITEVKDPAFESARAREAKGESIANSPVSQQQHQELVQAANQIIERTPEMLRAEQKRRLSSFMGTERPMTEAEARVEALRASIDNRPANTTVFEPMTMDQAEGMRRYLNDKNAQKIEGYASLDGIQAGDLSAKLQAAMTAFEPRSAEWINKYRTASEPISRAKAGRGEAFTELEMKQFDQEAEAMFSADKKQATNYYLDGSEDRAKRLLDLTGGKNLDLMNAIAGHFRTQLEGMTATQAEKLIKDNEGLLRVFPELKKPMQDVALAKSVAEKAPKEAERKASEAATRISGQKGTAEQIISRYRTDLTKVDELFNANQTKEALGKFQGILDKLEKVDKVIDPATHRMYTQKILEIESQFKDSAEAKRRLRQLMYGTLGIGTTAVIGPRVL